MIGADTGGSEGTNVGCGGQSGAMPFHHTPRIERSLDILPEPLVARIRRIYDRRPVHDLIQAGDPQILVDEIADLAVSVVAA